MAAVDSNGATIFVVDDDFASEALVEALNLHGFNAERLRSTALAMKNLERLASADLVILDLMMEGGNGAGSAGMKVATAVRKRNPDASIMVLSGVSDPTTIATLRSAGLEFRSKQTYSDIHSLIEQIELLAGPNARSRTPEPPVVFIVHGHDEAAKLDLKNYLQNTLRLPEPIILHEQPSLGRTIIEKFEAYASRATLVFVLLTPDDKGAAVTADNDMKRRARQNVIFEMGYFLAKLGRHSGRVILLHKGGLELPTDIAGMIYIDITHGIGSAGEIIRKELASALA
ncbi:MAG TPA: TIR domain-containing protein [Phycisphaerales bacterium]|nr:TIR domain-containing protein [Phycisphaerales bacterium]